MSHDTGSAPTGPHSLAQAIWLNEPRSWRLLDENGLAVIAAPSTTTGISSGYRYRAISPPAWPYAASTARSMTRLG